jgi:hypothetical protein
MELTVTPRLFNSIVFPDELRNVSSSALNVSFQSYMAPILINVCPPFKMPFLYSVNSSKVKLILLPDTILRTRPGFGGGISCDFT